MPPLPPKPKVPPLVQHALVAASLGPLGCGPPPPPRIGQPPPEEYAVVADCVFSGRVVDETGAPLAQATVLATGNGMARQLQTDAQGGFEVNMPMEQISIEVSMAGRSSVRLSLVCNESPLTVTLPDAHPLQPVRIGAELTPPRIGRPPPPRIGPPVDPRLDKPDLKPPPRIGALPRATVNPDRPPPPPRIGPPVRPDQRKGPPDNLLPPVRIGPPPPRIGPLP